MEREKIPLTLVYHKADKSIRRWWTGGSSFWRLLNVDQLQVPAKGTQVNPPRPLVRKQGTQTKSTNTRAMTPDLLLSSQRKHCLTKYNLFQIMPKSHRTLFPPLYSLLYIFPLPHHQRLLSLCAFNLSIQDVVQLYTPTSIDRCHLCSCVSWKKVFTTALQPSVIVPTFRVHTLSSRLLHFFFFPCLLTCPPHLRQWPSLTQFPSAPCGWRAAWQSLLTRALTDVVWET